MWVVALFLGSLPLILLWIFIRRTDLNFLDFWIKIAPLCLIGNVFYWYAFRVAPSFVTARYIMSGITHTMGWLAVLIILKEPITWQQIIGAMFIMVGIWIMGKGI